MIKKNRFSLFPLEFPEIWSYYEKIDHNWWRAAEITYSKDKQDFQSLNEKESHFLKMTLGFFAQSDSIVNENLVLNFYKDIDLAEIRQFYAFQIANEAVHAHVYNMFIEELVGDLEEKNKLFDAVNNIPTIAEKAGWAINWISNNRSLAERLFAFAIVEGLFFSGSFCSIYWFRTQHKKMFALAEANQFISRDEGIHWTGAATIYHLLVKLGKIQPISKKAAYKILEEAVEIESKFVTDSLPVAMIGMNSKLMIEYIKSQADNILSWFKFDQLYKTRNPFDFMILLDAPEKANFFERTPTSYQKAGPAEIELQTDGEW